MERAALAALQQVVRIETVVEDTGAGFMDVNYVHQATGGGNCDNRSLFVKLYIIFEGNGIGEC